MCVNTFPYHKFANLFWNVEIERFVKFLIFFLPNQFKVHFNFPTALTNKTPNKAFQQNPIPLFNTCPGGFKWNKRGGGVVNSKALGNNRRLAGERIAGRPANPDSVKSLNERSRPMDPAMDVNVNWTWTKHTGIKLAPKHFIEKIFKRGNDNKQCQKKTK